MKLIFVSIYFWFLFQESSSIHETLGFEPEESSTEICSPYPGAPFSIIDGEVVEPIHWHTYFQHYYLRKNTPLCPNLDLVNPRLKGARKSNIGPGLHEYQTEVKFEIIESEIKTFKARLSNVTNNIITPTDSIDLAQLVNKLKVKVSGFKTGVELAIANFRKLGNQFAMVEKLKNNILELKKLQAEISELNKSSLKKQELQNGTNYSSNETINKLKALEDNILLLDSYFKILKQDLGNVKTWKQEIESLKNLKKETGSIKMLKDELESLKKWTNRPKTKSVVATLAQEFETVKMLKQKVLELGTIQSMMDALEAQKIFLIQQAYKNSNLEVTIYKLKQQITDTAKKLKLQNEMIKELQKQNEFQVDYKVCEDSTETKSRKKTIQLSQNSNDSIKIYCDQDTDGGRWNVFQRRRDGSVNFYRKWKVYRKGFGNPDKEFWLGLETLHQMTNDGRTYELRFDLEKQNGSKYFAVYDDFKIASESEGYAVRFSGYKGNAGDSFSHHLNMKFSTRDKDQDGNDGNCALVFNGGWWYNEECHTANLNGYYNSTTFGEGLNWKTLTGYKESLAKTEMKFRAK